MPNDNLNISTPIPFSFFVSLCKELSKIEPRNVRSTKQRAQDSQPIAIKVLKRWVQELRQRFPRPPQGTTTNLFLFIFPEEDVHRKYGMQEATLAKGLAAVLGVSDKKGGRGAKLKQWASSSNNASSLGDEVYELMSQSYVDDKDASSICLNELSSLLDELATKSSFSSSAVRSSANRPVRMRHDVLQAAYRGLRPFEAAVLTQIILKDLRPVIYPVKDTSTTSSLLDFNVAAIHELTLHEAMRVWDPSDILLRCYRVQSTIEHSINLFEEGPSRIITPKIGVPIQIPKCVKGQGCANALANFRTSTSVWAETKYDGERMQIHVAVDESGVPEITIFSKSKRDSTMDRIASHWIIREALGLPHKCVEEIRALAAPRARSQIVSSIILDAEMVAYDDSTGIDEFWRIRELVESTAYGARKKVRFRFNQLKEQSTVSVSRASRHLALVFFDILYLNERSFLSQPYCTRRAILEEIISPIPSYASLAYREEIPLSQTKSPCQGFMDLQRIFQNCIINHEEGLVLKGSEATYADWRNPWVKLKKDYIPGHGDSVDLVIIAATWEKDRGRSLRVPTSTYTTFYVGVACNKPGLVKLRPHFEVVFTVSYGLDRNQLEELNHLIRTMGTVDYETDMQRSDLSFTFNLAISLTKPRVVLTTPLLVDLFGAGFTKSDGTSHYELRFPRISKVYRSNDRNWREGLNMEQYNKIVHEAIGNVKSTSEERNNLVLMTAGFPTKRKPFGTLQIRNFAELGVAQLPDTYEYSELSSSRCQKRRKVDENTFQCSTISTSPCRRPGSFAWANTDVRRCAKGPLKYVTKHEAENDTHIRSEVFIDYHSYTEIGETTKADQRFPEVKLAFAPFVNEYDVHPFAAFLDRSVILSNCSFSSPEYDKEFINKFVLPNLVHSYEAIAFACRWSWSHEATMLVRGEPARYGILFIDKQSSRNLQEILPFVTSQGGLEAGRRPVFVFSAECLRAEALQGGWKDNEMDIKTRCLAVYL